VVAAKLIFLGQESAPKLRADVHHGEKLGRNPHPLYLPGFALARHVENRRSDQRHVRRGGALALPEPEVCRINGKPRAPRTTRNELRYLLVDGVQLSRRAIGKRAQDDAVHHGEDGCVCAHTERERKHGQGCKAWIVRERAQAVADTVLDARQKVIPAASTRLNELPIHFLFHTAQTPCE